MKIAITLTSSMHVGQEYIELTQRVAKILAKNGHSIVYGGTEYGMMMELAQVYKDADGKELIGVMAKDLMAVTKGYKAYSHLDAQYIEETMSARKEKIVGLADAVLVLPGGYGTMEELIDYVGGKVNKLYDKPIGILNYQGFYNTLSQFLDELHAKKFSKIRFADVAFLHEDLNAILDHFSSYEPAILADKFIG
jgi:uncharacterized protein (TIGR00730 family)